MAYRLGSLNLFDIAFHKVCFAVLDPKITILYNICTAYSSCSV